MGLTEVIDTLALVDNARLPILDTVVHMEEGGAGCALGVSGSPCLNVELP